MKYKYIVLILVVFCSVFVKLYAQNTTIDSLENLLQQHLKKDTIRVNLLNEIAYELHLIDIDKTIKYAEEAEELAGKIDYAKGKAESLRLTGIYYFIKSDYSSALDSYLKALKIYVKFDLKSGISKCYNNIGIIYHSQGNYPEALDYYQKALKIKEELGDKAKIATSLNNIGSIYKNQSDYSKALEYYKKSLKIYLEAGDKYGISSCYNNIGVIHIEQGDYPKAIEYYNKSLIINRETGDITGIASCFNNIGIILIYQGDYPKALEYCQKALKIREKIGNKKEISISLINIGTIHKELGDCPKALEYFQKSLKMREELGDKWGISSCFSQIGDIYKDQEHHSKALDYYQKAFKIREELGDKSGISLSYTNIGNIYFYLADYPKALEYFRKSLTLSIEIGNKPIETLNYKRLGSLYLKQKTIKKAYYYGKRAYLLAEKIGEVKLLKESSEILAITSEAMGLYKDAYKYHVVFKTMNDSLYNEERIKKISGLQYQHKYEKEKQAAELIQQKKDAVYAEETKRQKIISYSFISGFILMTLLVLVILRSLLQKRKANLILAAQKKEIKTFAKELEIANKTKDKFFSIIAHDLKSPFNAIIGLSEVLFRKHQEFTEEKLKELLKMINSSSITAYQLLENLFTWARSQSGKIQYIPEKLSLKKVVSEVMDGCKGAANKKEIKLVTKMIENDIVFVDQNMIDTILRNLVFNAIKFTHKNGEVIVSSEKGKDNNLVYVSVDDNGVGIRKEKIKDLFRIDKNTTTKGTEEERGTGLGLLLCKEFVEKNGGKIWVESIVGKGSTFKFTLPTEYMFI